MKLLRYGEPGKERPGMLDGEGRIRDLSSIVKDIAGPALARGSLSQIARLDPESLPEIDPRTRLAPCVGDVGNFIGVGLNYADHAKEAGMPIPEEPVLFSKATTSISGPNDPIILPPGAVKTDWEVEIAFVIGEEAHFVPEADALSVIAGFCVCNDVSERSYQMERGGQWMKGKSAPSFGPLGPWLVTPDEIDDVQSLGLWLDVNGERCQTGSTATMIFSIVELVTYITRFMKLMPGDVVTTGTPPGVGLAMSPPTFLKPGDVVDLGIDALGAQRQVVIAQE
jgi:2,4-didehydro-3-deoxy-L-rhamnonate hydrolase